MTCSAGRNLPCGIILFILLVLPSLSAAATLSGMVQWIHDGDTIQVGGIGTVRLLGIDAPEQEASHRDRFFRRWKISPENLRRTHREGKTYLIGTLKGQTVLLKTDAEQRDRYGRLLAYVYTPEDKLVNQDLLEKGYAVVYRRFDFGLKEEFLAAEAEARNARRGVWRGQSD